jgi:hypothetical protein
MSSTRDAYERVVQLYNAGDLEGLVAVYLFADGGTALGGETTAPYRHGGMVFTDRPADLSPSAADRARSAAGYAGELLLGQR